MILLLLLLLLLCSHIEISEHSNCRLVPYWREFLGVSGSRTWSDTPFANTLRYEWSVLIIIIIIKQTFQSRLINYHGYACSEQNLKVSSWEVNVIMQFWKSMFSSVSWKWRLRHAACASDSLEERSMQLDRRMRSLDCQMFQYGWMGSTVVQLSLTSGVIDHT